MKRVGRHPNRVPASVPILDKLVRRLVFQAAHRSGSQVASDDKNGDVIVDTEIDGVRCLMVQSRGRREQMFRVVHVNAKSRAWSQRVIQIKQLRRCWK